MPRQKKFTVGDGERLVRVLFYMFLRFDSLHGTESLGSRLVAFIMQVSGSYLRYSVEAHNKVGPIFSQGGQNFQEKMVRPDRYSGNFGPPNQFFRWTKISVTPPALPARKVYM